MAETSARTASTCSSVTAAISASLQPLADHRRGVGRSRLGNHVVAVEVQQCEVAAFAQPCEQFVGDVRRFRFLGAPPPDRYLIPPPSTWARQPPPITPHHRKA